MQDSPELRARQYAGSRRRPIDLTKKLGHGEDGEVWQSETRTAVKCFHRQKNYDIELACYLRLKHAAVKKIGDFHIPTLIDYDDKLLVIEIAIVTPPFLLDFGKSYLDQEPDYPADVVEEHKVAMHEMWGERYDEVAAIVWALQRQFGIYYVDPKPGNICFAEGVEDSDAS